MLIFSQKADDNLASLVKAIDEVQKSNSKLGTVVVGVSGVEAADLEKLQTTHQLTTPLTVAVDKDGPKAYKLNRQMLAERADFLGNPDEVTNRIQSVANQTKRS